jgi:hypothetical protein
MGYYLIYMKKVYVGMYPLMKGVWGCIPTRRGSGNASSLIAKKKKERNESKKKKIESVGCVVIRKYKRKKNVNEVNEECGGVSGGSLWI